MAKKNPKRQPLTIGRRFTSLERLVRSGFRQTDAGFRSFDKRTDVRFRGFQKLADARFRGLSSDLRALRRQTDIGFNGVRSEFRNLRKEMDTKFDLVHLEFRNVRNEANERFTRVEDRIDRLATHVDGFMKLHETLDIEVRVMKEQMNRFEERLNRLEAGRAS